MENKQIYDLILGENEQNKLEQEKKQEKKRVQMVKEKMRILTSRIEREESQIKKSQKELESLKEKLEKLKGGDDNVEVQEEPIFNWNKDNPFQWIIDNSRESDDFLEDVHKSTSNLIKNS